MVPDDAQRAALARALAGCLFTVAEAPDTAHGMAALGRARFVAVVLAEGRPLTTQGFCLLARKRHAGTPIFILADPRRAPGVAAPYAHVGEEFLDAGMAPVAVARHVLAVVQAPPPTPFDVPSTTMVWETLDRAAMERHVGASPPSPPPAVTAERAPVAGAPARPPPAILPPHALQPVPKSQVPFPVAPPRAGAPVVTVPAAAPVQHRHVVQAPPSPAQTAPSPAPRTPPSSSSAPPPSPPRAADAMQATVLVPSPVAPEAVSGASLGLRGPMVMAGELADLPGAALMMTVLAQRLTGVLKVEGSGADGLYCFYAGDPVWVEDGRGDAGLFQDLCTAGVVPAGTRRPQAPAGQLLSALATQAALPAGVLERTLALMLRDRLVALSGARAGTFRFHEHAEVMSTIPLLRLNAFAAVVLAVRTAHARGLPALDAALRGQHVVGTANLAPVSERLAPLVGGVKLSELLVVPTSVPDLWSRMKLAPDGALVVTRALLDAQLVQACHPAASVEISLDLEEVPEQARAQALGGFGVLPDTEVEALPSAADVHAAARDHIMTMYMRLKPLASPHHVLGVPLGATMEQARTARDKLVKQLAADQVPVGPHQAVLTGHLHELRTKVDAALEALGFRGAAEDTTGRRAIQASLVTLGERLDARSPAAPALRAAAGPVVVNARALRAADGTAALLAELAARPGTQLMVAGLSLAVMSSFERGTLEALRGHLVDVHAPASCAGCRDKGLVHLDGTWLADTVHRPPRPCLECGHPARVRISDRQRTALESWLVTPVPAWVHAVLPPMEPPAPLGAAATPPPSTPAPMTPATPSPAVPAEQPMTVRVAPRSVPAPAPLNGVAEVPATVAARASPRARVDSAPLAPVSSATSGARYVDLRVLGRGGMGEVVLARQEGQAGFSRVVALKRVIESLAQDPEVRQMFLHEARTAARVSHANVVHIYDLGQDEEDRLYLAMEYVRGWDLRSVLDALLLARRHMPWPVACRIIADVCTGLHAAHTATDEQGRALRVVHRDVSAQNVLLSTAGGAKVTDFGIAHALDSTLLTRPGTRKGKPSYMAPEQVDSSRGQVDARTDVWAVGVLMHEMLTAQPLFRTGQVDTTLAAVLGGPIPSVIQRRPDVPPGLDAAVQRALRRPQAERHAGAMAMAQALEQVLFGLGRPTTHAEVAQWLAVLVRDGVLKAPAEPGTAEGAPQG